MNIGIYTDVYKPQTNGVVTVITNLEKELIHRGHNVYIFTVNYPKAQPQDNVYRIPSIQFPGEANLRIGLDNIPGYVKKAEKLDLDIIHTQTEFILFNYAKDAAEKLEIPIVHTNHTLYEEYTHYLKAPKELVKKIIKHKAVRISRKMKAMIAPSQKIKTILEEYGVGIPVIVIPNGIDISCFYSSIKDSDRKEKINSFRSKYDLSPEDKIVFFIGRIAPEKSIDMLLMNMCEVVKHEPKAKLVIAGQGPSRTELESMSRKLGIHANVRFTGKLEWPHEVAIGYQASDLFASCSHTEVHPITFIEALASKTPVVAYDDPSIRGMVLHGENGFLYQDKLQLWEGILEIFNSPELARSMGERSLQISTRYSVQHFADETEKVYQTYAKSKKNRPV